MPSFESSTVKPDKDDVRVRSIHTYATLWSQYLSDASGSTILYYFLGPFFFVHFLLTLLTSEHLLLITEPQVFPVQIPSTTEDAPETPIAYTYTSEYESQFDSIFARPLRIFTLGRVALTAYLTRTRIAYVLCSPESIVDEDAYLIAEDDDSLRPYVLFR